jgi:hypothetical protein
MCNLCAALIVLCGLFYATDGQQARAAEADIDCFNPASSVESAVCGDPMLLKLYKMTDKAYQRVQSNPVALGIYLDLLHARAVCVKPHLSYKDCIVKHEFLAYTAFNKLKPGRPKHPVGHFALGIPI